MRFDVHIYERPPVFTDQGADRGPKLTARYALSERSARTVMCNWRALGYHAIRRNAGRPVGGR